MCCGGKNWVMCVGYTDVCEENSGDSEHGESRMEELRLDVPLQAFGVLGEPKWVESEIAGQTAERALRGEKEELELVEFEGLRLTFRRGAVGGRGRGAKSGAAELGLGPRLSVGSGSGSVVFLLG